MIKKKTPRKGRIEIDLTGPDGNAWALMGYANQLCKILNLDYDKIKKEMMSSDYENLVQVFDKNFGSYVTLYR